MVLGVSRARRRRLGGEGKEEKGGMNREACKRVLQAPRQI